MTIVRVAWDNRLASQDKAGTGVYAARLLQHLAKRPDLRMDIMGGNHRLTQGARPSAAVHATGNVLWTHVCLPLLLSRNDADVVHAPAFVAPTVSPCPVIITIHDVSYLLYPSHFARWWVGYLSLVMPSAVKSAAAIICGSENSKRDIVKAYGIGDHKVHVVPYGVDHDRFQPGVVLNRQWGKEIGLREGYILHLGTFSHRKNICVLLHAVARLRARGKWGDRQVVLAGSQTAGLKGGQEVLDAIRELDLSSYVVLTGYMPDEHIPGLYACASMLVLPSLYEGFGFPILEAMAVGTPVVCSNTSSLPEVGGDAALFFPPHDADALAGAMESLLQSQSLAEQMRQRGLARAHQFTWRRTAEQTADIYREVATS
jgi:glycosyltransferase involved in cell wall biosynthesis